MKCALILVVCVSTILCETSSKDEVKDKDVMDDIMKDINGHKVMVYSKTYCPYSKKLKALLKTSYEIEDMKIVELDKEPQMREMQDVLSTLSGRTTVPQLFIDGKFVGGHDETREMEDDGKLRPMLEKAHALKKKEHEGNEF